MAYLVKHIKNCCNRGINRITSWSYVPANGGNVRAFENTYYQGNVSDYAWMDVDDQELDECGNLRGAFIFYVQCTDPCSSNAEMGLPLELVQVGGFAMPQSQSSFPVLYRPAGVIYTGGVPQITAFDIPYGATISIQAFGGVGARRYWSATNDNLVLSDGRRINNYVTDEPSLPDVEIYAPHLYGLSANQLSAGVKYVYQRRFGEGAHVISITANKIGPNYLQCMDEFGCIRYWAINVVSSHCYDWVNDAPRKGPDTTNSVKTVGDFSSANQRRVIFNSEFRAYPMDEDGNIVHQYYTQQAQDANSAQAWCECEIHTTENSAEARSTYSSNPEGAELDPAGTPFVNANRFFGESTRQNVFGAEEIEMIFPRTLNGKNGGYLYVGEEVRPLLPDSLVKSAVSNKIIGADDYTWPMPLVAGDEGDVKHYYGATSKNTGPLKAVRNDDAQFVSSSTRRDEARVSTTGPTNFLSSNIEYVTKKIQGKSYYGGGEWDYYKYFAPPVAHEPNEVNPTSSEPQTIVYQKNVLAWNEDPAEISYLEYNKMGPRISWTQNAVVACVRSMCPAFDVFIDPLDINGNDLFDFIEDPKTAGITSNSNFFLRIGINFVKGYHDAVDVRGINSLGAHWPGPFTYVTTQDQRYAYNDDLKEGLLFSSRPQKHPFYKLWPKRIIASEYDFHQDYRITESLAKDSGIKFDSGYLYFYFGFSYGGGAGQNPYEFDRLGPDTLEVDQPYFEDEWFLERQNDPGAVFFDFKHVPKSAKWKRMLSKRDFYDDSNWDGIDEQPRGCNCMAANVEPLKWGTARTLIFSQVRADPFLLSMKLDDEDFIHIGSTDGLGQGESFFDRGIRGELS